jgi:hypothetical protein
MFWLFPFMPANLGACEQQRQPSPARKHSAPHAFAARPPHTPQPLASRTAAIADTIVDASRDSMLRGTTYLSRTFEGLRRFFARVRAGFVHERWMHSAFGWALSPAQRLLPSTAWHLVRPAPSPRQVHGPLDAPFAVASTLADAGFAMWRGALAMTTPRLPAPPQWPLLPPSSPARCTGGAGDPVTATMSLLAPMAGLAMGMGAWMPTAPGLFF